MAAYAPEPYPAPLHTRSRRSSTASQRYHPDNYTPSPPQAPPLTPAGYPYAYGKPAPPAAMPLIDTRSSYGPPPGQSVSPDVHPATAAYSPLAVSARPPYPLSDADAVVNQPLPSDMMPRQQSYNSMHSKRSQDSRRSHESRRSRDSHRSRRGHRSSPPTDEEIDRERRHRRRDDKERRHRHNSDHDQRHVKRADAHRPSFGETLLTMVDGIKTAGYTYFKRH